MGTIADNLDLLEQTLTDIKTSLTNQGVTVSDALVDVPDEIDSISGGGSLNIYTVWIRFQDDDTGYYYLNGTNEQDITDYDYSGSSDIQRSGERQNAYRPYQVYQGSVLIPKNWTNTNNGEMTTDTATPTVVYKRITVDGDPKLQMTQVNTDNQQITFKVVATAV